MQVINDGNLLGIMLTLQDVAVDLILVDLEIPKDFSLLPCPGIWIANSGALNNGTSCMKGTINLRKDESPSCTMGILGKVVKNRCLYDITGVSLAT